MGRTGMLPGKEGKRMNLASVILDLEHLRYVEWRCWEDYHEEAKTESYLRGMRDTFEMHVRALDYAINILKKMERSNHHDCQA